MTALATADASSRPARLARRFEPRLSARGHLTVHEPDDGAPLEPDLAEQLTPERAHETGPFLLELGARLFSRALPPTWSWLAELARSYFEQVRIVPEGEPLPELAPDPERVARILAAPPAIVGADHLSEDVLAALWSELDRAFRAALARHDGAIGALLASYHPGWHQVGRVVFNLAENKKDPEYPFAFMATYTTRLSASGKAQHLPLGRALEEYSAKKDKPRLVALLGPVQRAAESCAWLAAMVREQTVFVPVRWSAAEASALLADVPLLEDAGVMVRMPQQWGGQRPSRPVARALIGSGDATRIGQQALLDFKVQVALDGQALSEAEIEALLAQSAGLVLLRGRWVELDPARLRRARERLERVQARLGDGVDLQRAMQLLAGAELHDLELPERDWSEIFAGPWLEAHLARLRDPDRLDTTLARDLRGALRPYQAAGVRWLDALTRLGLGALLADDMGLGKTIQVISLLLLQKERGLGPSLLVVPASLIGNWTRELERFAPSLRFVVAHGSAMSASAITTLDADALAPGDVVITTYGTASREPRPAWLTTTTWQLLICDEAQALKNAETRQARALKDLSACARVAMTGTPIENRLGDLWSLFDFLNPGLLGSAAKFNAWMKGATARGPSPWAPLRELVRPYILRRKKTDRAIIADLPDKTEIETWCALSRRQAALYQEAVDELADKLAQSEGMQRRGLVLATLMRLKQICNHPSQWLGDGDWQIGDSGKLVRLGELAETIGAAQEKVLVFTQFREITEVLARCLTAIFGAPGLVLTGQTPVAKRKALVQRFQEDEAIPFFVLSLKAGGTGLNLTAASHVIHFDRWWNPAVEDQATDRAFRIGQKKNVMVHKLACRGTVEERIAALIADKRGLARDVIDEGAEIRLTELSDEALLDLVRLDLAAISGGST